MAKGRAKSSACDAAPLVGPAELAAAACSTGTLRVPAQPAYLALVGMVLRWFCGRAGLNDEKCHELEVAVDEACTNVIRHAFPPGVVGTMTVVYAPREDGVQVTIVNQGQRFDPAEGAERAREKRVNNPASGGTGLLLIEHLTDATEYRWDEHEGNCLTLVKHK